MGAWSSGQTQGMVFRGSGRSGSGMCLSLNSGGNRVRHGVGFQTCGSLVFTMQVVKEHPPSVSHARPGCPLGVRRRIWYHASYVFSRFLCSQNPCLRQPHPLACGWLLRPAVPAHLPRVGVGDVVHRRRFSIAPGLLSSPTACRWARNAPGSPLRLQLGTAGPR